MGAFTSQQVTELSSEIDALQQRATEASPGSKEALTKVGAASAWRRDHRMDQRTQTDPAGHSLPTEMVAATRPLQQHCNRRRSTATDACEVSIMQDARRIGEAFLALVRTSPLLDFGCLISHRLAPNGSDALTILPPTFDACAPAVAAGKVRKPELPGLPQGREEARQAAAARALPAVLHARAAQPALGPGWVSTACSTEGFVTCSDRRAHSRWAYSS